AGRTVTAFYTYGGPRNSTEASFDDPFGSQLKYGILNFCGFENIELYPFYETIGFRNIRRRQKLIDDMARFGSEGK
ncbi:MAG: hypothetical protein LBP39_03595, partial [Rickettsiales bacterium]|nr:hypothetical protein [Rickettsiales bacterium]